MRWGEERRRGAERNGVEEEVEACRLSHSSLLSRLFSPASTTARGRFATPAVSGVPVAAGPDDRNRTERCQGAEGRTKHGA